MSFRKKLSFVVLVAGLAQVSVQAGPLEEIRTFVKKNPQLADQFHGLEELCAGKALQDTWKTNGKSWAENNEASLPKEHWIPLKENLKKYKTTVESLVDPVRLPTLPKIQGEIPEDPLSMVQVIDWCQKIAVFAGDIEETSGPYFFNQSTKENPLSCLNEWNQAAQRAEGYYPVFSFVMGEALLSPATLGLGTLWHVFLLGSGTKSAQVHGDRVNPVGFLDHDINHANKIIKSINDSGMSGSLKQDASTANPAQALDMYKTFAILQEGFLKWLQKGQSPQAVAKMGIGLWYILHECHTFDSWGFQCWRRSNKILGLLACGLERAREAPIPYFARYDTREISLYEELLQCNHLAPLRELNETCDLFRSAGYDTPIFDVGAPPTPAAIAQLRHIETQKKAALLEMLQFTYDELESVIQEGTQSNRCESA